MMRIIPVKSILLIILVFLSACDSDDDNERNNPNPPPGPPPELVITTPSEGFFKTMVWEGGAAPENNILTVVSGEVMTDDGLLSVFVNGEEATEVVSIGTNSYQFNIKIPLSKGEATITAVATTSLGGSTTVLVSGVADYCTRGFSKSGVKAEKGNNQSTRCHEINGCNKDQFGRSGYDTNHTRNQPMPKAVYNQVLIEFGSGYLPDEGLTDDNNDRFVHNPPAMPYTDPPAGFPERPLGCNIHDTCYQTCVPESGRDRRIAWHSCNRQQRDNHYKMCDRAYPNANVRCPFGRNGRECRKMKKESEKCHRIARKYYAGVESTNIPFIKDGWEVYIERQKEYCAS